MRKEVWFGLSIMAFVVILVFVLMPAPSQMTNGHLGLLMLAMIVVGIMLGFPTAFTLMGMGVIFALFAYWSVDPKTAVPRVLDLFVQRTYGVMSNDVLIAIPLFLFMGYIVERAQLIDRLFRSLHLATARIPGALAVATIVTCAIFATATGIVGAVVTLMGLLAFPAMLKAGYNVKVAAGAITAGGCLGILIPPSVMLIVYGAVAGVSVVQLYAGAFLPGIMLATLYIGYIILLAWWKPHLMPPLPESERRVDLPSWVQAQARKGNNALTGLFRAASANTSEGVPKRTAFQQLVVTLLPAFFIVALLAIMYRAGTAPAGRGQHRRADPGRGSGCGAGAGAGRDDWSDQRGTRCKGSRGYGTPGGTRERRLAGRDESREGPDRILWRGKGRRKEIRRSPRRDTGAAPGASMGVDRVRRRHRLSRLPLSDLELGAAGSFQDAVELVLSACLADSGRARLDRVRARHAFRGGGGRWLRRIRARGDLSLHR